MSKETAKYVDERHRRLQEEVDSGGLLGDTENSLLNHYEYGAATPEFQGFPKNLPDLTHQSLYVL